MFNAINSISSLTLEDIINLQDKLFAVHITSDVPVAYKQIAVNMDLFKNLTNYGINQTPLITPILHWCLGRANPEFYSINYIEEQNDDVNDNSSIDFDDVITNQKYHSSIQQENSIFEHPEKQFNNIIGGNYTKLQHKELLNQETPKYAIVTKLKNLFPQLINIHFKYSITLDDYLLSNKDYVLLPENTDPGSWNTANIVYYDPTQITLNQAVIELIKQQNGIIIKETLEIFSDIKYNLHKYILEINQEKIYCLREKDPFIFSNIIQELAISFGTDEEIINGWTLSYLEGIQEKITLLILDLITSNDVEFGYTLEYLELIEYSAKCIQNSLSLLINNSTRFTIQNKEKFNLQQNNFYKWLKFFEIEKYLYLKYNKTLMGANKLHINFLIQNIDLSIVELLMYVDQKHQIFKQCIPVKIGGLYCLETYYLEKIYYIGISFFRKILLTDFLKIPGFVNNPGHILLYVLSHIKNYEIFETNIIDTEKMLKLLDIACIQLSTTENQQQQIYVYNILMVTIKHTITINSYTDEPITYGGKGAIDFLANKSKLFSKLLNSQSEFFNENYKLLTKSQDEYDYKFLQNLTLYNNKKYLNYKTKNIPHITTSVKKLTPKMSMF